MSLIFSGPGEGFERRWIVYAMLRDNIQYHLEGGRPTEEFAAIHALAGALTHGKTAVPALKLRAEVERARDHLLARPISDFAVSLRTRAVSTLSFPLPDARDSALASAIGWSVPFPTEGASTLGDLLGGFVDELLLVTEGAKGEDLVTVVDQ